MLLKRNFFSKPLPPQNLRFHMDDQETPEKIAFHLQAFLTPHIHRDIVFVCIGTDRSTGDSLGPLIGSKLKEKPLNIFHVYGTLEHPVHALNLEETLEIIKQKHKSSFVIGIDASLGKLTSVGQITIGNGPVKPGAAVNKKLPEVGDMHMTGIVNIGGMMEYVVLQNTRLSVVMKMANVIAQGIQIVDEKLSRQYQEQARRLPPQKPKVFIREKK